MGGKGEKAVFVESAEITELRKRANKDLTPGEKKKIKQANAAKANPGKAAEKKEKNDNCRDRRKESGSTKVINR